MRSSFESDRGKFEVSLGLNYSFTDFDFVQSDSFFKGIELKKLIWDVKKKKL